MQCVAYGCFFDAKPGSEYCCGCCEQRTRALWILRTWKMHGKQCTSAMKVKAKGMKVKAMKAMKGKAMKKAKAMKAMKAMKK